LLWQEFNHSLPKWLRFAGEYRTRVEGFTAGGFKRNNEDSYLLSRLRPNMTVQPECLLKFAFAAQNTRAFDEPDPPAPPSQDTMDLRQGYVEIGSEEENIPSSLFVLHHRHYVEDRKQA